MSQNILVISGKKQAGKTSLCNFLHGYVLKNTAGSIKEFEVDDEGELLVNAVMENGEGNIREGMAVLDVFRKDTPFTMWANQKMYPWVKGYNFADTLKEFCIRIFGLSPNQCYGTEDDKNTASTIKWSDISFCLPPRTVSNIKKDDKFDQYLSAREVLQQIGTNVCRKIRDNCWVDDCLNDVVRDQSQLAIICDARFINEIEGAKKVGAKVIRLIKKLDSEDTHESETELDSYDDYDFVLDNSKMTITEKNEAVLKELQKWGWI